MNCNQKHEICIFKSNILYLKKNLKNNSINSKDHQSLILNNQVLSIQAVQN